MRQKLIFVGMLLLLGLSELIMVHCPICGGDGYVDLGKTFHMENVQIVKAKSEVRSKVVACGIVVAYLVAVDVTLVNKGLDAAIGYISVTAFSDMAKILDEKTFPVRVPTGAPISFSITMLVGTQKSFVPREAVSREELVGGGRGRITLPTQELGRISVDFPSDPEISCPACGGKGRVTIMDWLALVSPLSSKIVKLPTQL